MLHGSNFFGQEAISRIGSRTIVREGRPITADVYLRRLGATCTKKGMTPAAMTERPRGKGLTWAFHVL